MIQSPDFAADQLLGLLITGYALVSDGGLIAQ
jgi:hypothetical protein